MQAAADLPESRRSASPLRLPLTAIAFWIFTYLLLSLRAEMLRGDGFDGLSVKRLAATSVGAILLGLVLAVSTGRHLSTSSRLAILGAIFPASAAVFAVRVTLDYFYYGEPLTLADDVRWVLVWAGYFGLWLSAALALSLGRLPLAAPAAARSPAAAAAPPRPAPEAWDWLADAIVDEFADAPGARRAQLAERLLARAGYESADELDPDQQRQRDRVALARGVAARLTQKA